VIPGPSAEALEIRNADLADLPFIVALLADDVRGEGREDPSLPLAQSYLDAFAAITAAPDQQLVVAVEDGRIVGTLQLLLIPGLSHKGGWRGQIEAVRVVADRRGHGLGAHLAVWAVEACRRRGCVLVQLTSNNIRADAHRFWERQGFRPDRKGFVLTL
jgi:GNAT superfamily N-acetyltransferase